MTHSWSDEDRNAVADHLKAGLSASQIAKKLPFAISRNAIVGIVHRDGSLKLLGFVRPGNDQKKTRRQKPKPPQEKKPLEKRPDPPSVLNAPYDPADDGIKSYYAAIAAKKARGDTHDWDGVPLARIGANQCRWPLWTDTGAPDFRLCGARTELDQVYCGAHRAKAARA